MRQKTLLAILLVWAALLLPAIAPALAQAGDFQARVVGITDGDTLKILFPQNKQQIKIRLASIDCPEKRQPYGNKAKQFAADLCAGQIVTVQATGKDRYGRTIAFIILSDGRCLNHELVRAGLAWWYRKYAPGDKELEELERVARDAKVGLWADSNAMAPWEWRKK